MNKPASYKPSAFYYRAALRAAATRAEVVALGLELVTELEKHKEWVRAHGLVPPKWFITPSEFCAKPPGLVSPFPSTKPESETAG